MSPQALGRFVKVPRANVLGTSTNPPSAFRDVLSPISLMSWGKELNGPIWPSLFLYPFLSQTGQNHPLYYTQMILLIKIDSGWEMVNALKYITWYLFCIFILFMSLFSRLFVQKKDLMQNLKHLKMISKLKNPTMRGDNTCRYVDCMLDNSTAVAINFEATCTLCSDMINGQVV